MKDLKNSIKSAKGDLLADLLIKNAKVVDVFSGKLVEKNLGIKDGVFLGFGDYKADKELDLKGKIISPGLIDAHVHIESAMVSPIEFAKAIIPHGVTTVIADPHEIANVAGSRGIKYILDSTKNIPLDVKVMLPSCVPATPFENSGGVLKVDDLLEFIDEERVLGLGEMMNYVGVFNLEEDVIEKLHAFKDKMIDGHAPSIKDKNLNAYAISGIKTDHECANVEEMEDRISRGMYVIIREGTAARNASSLLSGVTKDNISRCMFCTDDKHPEDLIKEGSINKNIKIAINKGIDPIDAIKIGSINSALAYNLKNKGAIAPGYVADFLVLDSLEDFNILEVYIKGEKYAENKKMIKEISLDKKVELGTKVNTFDYSFEDFKIPMSSPNANVIGVIPGEIITEKLKSNVKVENGEFVADNDFLKFAVVERHNGLNSLGLGIIKGIGLKKGAIASTIAHDSHNIIIIGDNDEDMFMALEEIKKINGGVVLVQNGQILKSLVLEIGGLMSDKSLEDINKEILEILDLSYEKLHINREIDPIITLGFMALPVIPHIKLTDKGLFDVDKFEFMSI